MNPIEILLGVAFPVIVGLVVALAMGPGGTAQFLIAKILAVAAAADVFGLTVWWLYKSKFSFATVAPGVLVGACLVLALPAILRWIDGREIAATQQPDVSLRFVHPKSPALVIINKSDVVARDIKWTVVLWNMDLPDRNDPLPIPVSTFDWLRPHSESGPQSLFGSGLVAPLLKRGNRLFGSASVVCPTCDKGRTYIVYIVWDEGGWFAQIGNEKSGDVLIPRNFLKESRLKYFSGLEAAVPTQSRVPIGGN